MQKRDFIVFFLFLICLPVVVYAAHEDGHIDEAVDIIGSGSSASSDNSESADSEIAGDAYPESEINYHGLGDEDDISNEDAAGLSNDELSDEEGQPDSELSNENEGEFSGGKLGNEDEISKTAENGQMAELDSEFSGAKLQEDAGITPDSGFYFIEDAILSRFRNDLENREKKVAEIKAMVESGDIGSARLALVKYRVHTDKLEKEIGPEKREEARRSAAAIRNAMREIEDELPEDAREEFVGEIREREGKIVTAVEIAGKIKELCGQLSNLDPLEYERVCKTNDDAPEWQRKLHKDLTDEQEKEAKEFFGLLSQCMRTSGKECRCKDISVNAFADQCSIVAPLASACDEGNDEACKQMEEQTNGIEELLPDYLQDVMRQVEGRFEEDRFDMHMPEECREAGAKTPKECMKVMIRLNAPEECVEELEKRDVRDEREARKICEEIMFKQNAPQECIDAGLNDHKECGKFMFEQSAPKECVDAGLTGESPSDGKKCREIMDSLGRKRGGPGPMRPMAGDCRRIENAEERLKCYDEASKDVGENYENRQPLRGWPSQCEEKGATTRESCEKVMMEWGRSQRQEFGRREHEGFRRPGDSGAIPGCEGLSPEECRMKFGERRGEFPPGGYEGDHPPEGFMPPPEGYEGEQPSQEGDIKVLEPEPASELTSEPEPTSEPASELTSEPEPTSEPAPSVDSGITGGIIFENMFLDYYFK